MATLRRFRWSIFCLLTGLLCHLLLVISLVDVFRDAGLHIQAPGTTPLTISRAGTYTLWHESQTQINGQLMIFEDDLPAGTVIHVSEPSSGTTIPLHWTFASSSVQINRMRQVTLGSMYFPAAGNYQITISGLSENRVLYLDRNRFPLGLCGAMLLGPGGLVFYLAALGLLIHQWTRSEHPRPQRTFLTHATTARTSAPPRSTLTWLDPWWPTDEQDQAFHTIFRQQLEREVGPDHPLHGLPVRLIARGNGDDALFEIQDGTGRVAQVHLTWTKRGPEPLPWPATTLHDNLGTWATDVMAPAHRAWIAESAE